MGMTLSSVHILADAPVSGIDGFLSLSDGWQSYVPNNKHEDLFELRKYAKSISKKTSAPVLWFYLFDEEAIQFEFYQNGKRISAYSSQEQTAGKNLYCIPGLIGYADGQKRRLSRILSCADINYQVELLEEYFGVCLLVCPEAMDEPLEAFRRVRSDEKYQRLLAEDSMLTGKQAKIKAKLIFEEKGKLFEKRFSQHENTYKPHYYYFGYSALDSNWHEDALNPVQFVGDQLLAINQEQFDDAESLPRKYDRNDERVIEEFYPVYKVFFTEKSPIGFRGKTFVMPRGYGFGWFDSKDRMVVTDEKGGLMVVTEDLKVIAKLKLKGMPVDYVDDYVLTVGSNSFSGYCYHPNDAVRIYQLIDTDNL